MWKTLRHQNILPLMGVMMSENQFVMISEWMMNGNINNFVRTRSDVNRVRLVGFVHEVFALALLTIVKLPS